MESANREEAKRCLEKAEYAFRSGNLPYAKRLVVKSIKLCSSMEAEGKVRLQTPKLVCVGGGGGGGGIGPAPTIA